TYYLLFGVRPTCSSGSDLLIIYCSRLEEKDRPRKLAFRTFWLTCPMPVTSVIICFDQLCSQRRGLNHGADTSGPCPHGSQDRKPQGSLGRGARSPNCRSGPFDDRDRRAGGHRRDLALAADRADQSTG